MMADTQADFEIFLREISFHFSRIGIKLASHNLRSVYTAKF